MKTKIGLIVFITAFYSLNLVSQNESLRNQIMNYERQDHDFLARGRQMLQDCLEKNDFEKVKEIKDLLLSDNDGNVYNTFYPNEYLFLLYWTKEYDELLDFIMHVNYLHPISNSLMDISANDGLFYSLKDMSVTNKHSLLNYIDESIISEMDKDFLALHLEDLLRSDLDSREINVDASHTDYVNKLSDEFLEKYPDSPYEVTIRESIRYKFEPAPLSYYFDVGLGVNTPTGNLGNNINSGLSVELALDLRYKRLVTMIGGDLSIQTPKNNLNVNGESWQRGTELGHSLLFLNVGALLADDEKFSFYPFAGFGYSGFTMLESYDSPSGWFPQLGLGVDFKIGKSKLNPYYGENLSSRISVRYAYRIHNYSTISQNLEGGYHSITLSLGFGNSSRKRAW